MSGSVKFNGVEILQPTNHRWSPRDVLGIGGGGHAIYPGVREYEMEWQLSSIGDYYQLLSAFANLSGTSTIVVDLPSFYSTGTYSPFYSYSGCVLREPEFREWFNGYYGDVKLLITNIRT
jgi:hypothetical protein